jgi:hypothetical protein
MQVKTNARTKTLRQVKQRPYYFLVRTIAKRFNDHQRLPIEVLREIYAGRIRFAEHLI